MRSCNGFIMYYSSYSATDNCLAGMKLTVFRGESATEETFSIATENFLKRTEGPVVAFYGLIQGTNLCIARLGGYRLLDSSELSSMFYFGLYTLTIVTGIVLVIIVAMSPSRRGMFTMIQSISVFDTQCMLYHACVPEKVHMHCTMDMYTAQYMLYCRFVQCHRLCMQYKV